MRPAVLRNHLQTDHETHEFSPQANAPAWRNEVAMSSLEAILEHAPSESVELIAPRPLPLILAKDDEVSSPDLIREAFARAGEPKRLREVEGRHYAVYPSSGGQSADEAIHEATEWLGRDLLLFAGHSLPTVACGPLPSELGEDEH